MSKRKTPSRRQRAAFQRMLCLSVPVAGAVLAAPAISRAATTGTITGVISAAKTDADDQPIVDPATANLVAGAPQSGVQVTLEPGGRKTVTDKSGRFTFTGVQPGKYTLRAELVTFDPGEAQVNVSQDLTSRADIILTKIVGQTEGEIEIEVVRPNVTTTTTEISARREQLIKSTPIQLYQVNGLIFGAPGITPDPEGYTHIRGGDDNQVGFQIDGIDITDPLTGTFGTNLVTVGLKNANLYTGGASAAYGGKTSGFINMVTQNGRDLRGGIFEYTGAPGYGHDYQGTNIQYGNAFGGDKFDVFANFIGFRNDFPNNTDVQSLNDSADGLLKVNYYLGPNDTITAYHSGGYEGYDYYQPRADFPDANIKYEDRQVRATLQPSYQQDHNTQGNHISYLTYRRNFGATSFATLRTYRFYTFVNFHLENSGLQFQRRTSTQMGYQLNYENQINPQYRLQAGLDYIPTTGALFEQITRFTGAGLDNPDWSSPDYGSASGYTHLLSRVKPVQTAAYLSNQFRLLDDRLTLDLGIRHAQMKYDLVKYDDFTRNYTDPRIGLTYTPVRNTVFRGNFSRNSQFPDGFRIERLFPEDVGFATARKPGDPNLPLDDPINVGSQYARMSGRERQLSPLKTIRSEGTDLGIEQGFNLRGPLSGAWQVVATAYRRNHWDLMQYNVLDWAVANVSATNRQRHFTSEGTAHASGVEFQLNKQRVRESDLNGFFSYTNQVARANVDSATSGLFPFYWFFVLDTNLTDADYRRLNRQEFAPSYDQRHTVALVANKRISKSLETTLIVDAGSGFPFVGGAPTGLGSAIANIDAQHGAEVADTGANFAEIPVLLLDGRTLQPTNPVVGRSGWHYKISLNTNFYVSRDSWFFLNVDNVFNRKFVTNYATTTPQGTVYYNQPTAEYPQGTIYYGKATLLQPTFLAFGIRTRF